MKAVRMMLAVGLGLSTPAVGQTGIVPAEQPPAAYAGREYIDSRGCAFARGTVNGTTVWLSRIDGQGKPVCELPSPGAQAKGTVAAVGAEGARSSLRTSRPAKAGVARPVRPVIPADRLVIALETASARAAGCDGPDRPVSVVTLRSGARYAACDGLTGDPQAIALAQGPEALGIALPPLDGPATLVHVGAYRDPANATRAAERLRGLGLRVARSSASGGSMTLVLTGPVGAGQVRGLLARLQASGFPDAYPDVMPPARPQPSQMP